MSRVTPKIMPRTRKRTAPKALGKARLEELVAEAIIDAYGESEQRVGFLTMLEDRLAVPFTTAILGAPVVSNAWISTMPKRSWRSAAADDSDN
jgi:hypothetical protein